MKNYFKIYKNNRTNSLQIIIYIVCQKKQLLEIYYEFSKAKTKAKLSYFLFNIKSSIKILSVFAICFVIFKRIIAILEYFL